MSEAADATHRSPEPPRPAGSPAVRMVWEDLLFLHWRVPAARLRPLIPPPLELDTFENDGWIGLVPFRMSISHVRGTPVTSLFGEVLECNVRTYVRHGEEIGVWFFSLDTPSRLAAWGARTFWGLNYRRARMSMDASDEGRFTFDVQRLDHHRRVHLGQLRGARADDPACPSMRCRWRRGEARPSAEPGGLDWFLTERYILYSVDKRGRLIRGKIHHPRWPLREATVNSLDDELVKVASVEVSENTPPLAYHVDRLEPGAWAVEMVPT